MTTTLLQRVHSLAEAPPLTLYDRLASVLRQFTSDKTAPEKAHGVTAVVMKLSPVDQERVLAAIESLRS